MGYAKFGMNSIPHSACFQGRNESARGNAPCLGRSVNRPGPPSMSRAELDIHGLNRWAATGLEKSEKREVQAAGNGPSTDGKYWQSIELGIHGLKSWGRNWSRKVREMRSSSLCSAHPARITRCKFLQLLRYLCQFMYLTTVKLVLRNSFDLNYLRKMCGTWVRWFPDILFQSIQADSHFIDRRLIDRRRDESSLSGRLAMAANHILSISELPGPLIFAANPVH